MKRENKGKAPNTTKRINAWLQNDLVVANALVSELVWGLDRGGDTITHYEIIQPKKAEKPEFSEGEQAPAHTTRKRLDGKRFIVTAAQNNVAVHADFLGALQVMAEHVQAEIVIIPFTYNLHGFEQKTGGDDIWYDPKIKPYLLDSDRKITSIPLVISTLNILPTAKNPLGAGVSEISGKNDVIVGHVSQQLRSVAVVSGNPKTLYSTGTCTNRAYIQRKAGQVADSMLHQLGALIVEIADSGNHFVRQLQGDETTGSFQDLGTMYTSEGFEDDWGIEAVILGDIHAETTNHELRQTAILPMLDELEPAAVVLHDLCNFSALNSHNRGLPQHERDYQGQSLQSDFDKVAAVLEQFCRHPCIVVESNHDQQIDRLLDDPRFPWAAYPESQECYFALQLAKVRGEITGPALEFCLYEFTEFNPQEAPVFLKDTDEYTKAGFLLSMHGHRGVNGARGSSSYQRMPIKSIVGHSHTASISPGYVVVGASCDVKAQGYTRGAPSSWSYSHALLYPSGAVAMVTMREASPGKYEWRA